MTSSILIILKNPAILSKKRTNGLWNFFLIRDNPCNPWLITTVI
jgi:hypothetical protein